MSNQLVSTADRRAQATKNNTKKNEGMDLAEIPTWGIEEVDKYFTNAKAFIEEARVFDKKICGPERKMLYGRLVRTMTDLQDLENDKKLNDNAEFVKARDEIVGWMKVVRGVICNETDILDDD
jgi:hypothetical protein